MASQAPTEQGKGFPPRPVSLSKQVLLYSISAIFFLLGLVGFMQISWLFSKPLPDHLRTELSQVIEVPEDARAYSINHGNYLFFTDTPADNPQKAAIIVLMIIGGIGTSISINIYLALKKRKLNAA